VAGSSFPAVGSTQAYGGNGDAFLTQLNGSGTALLYSTYVGGLQGDAGLSVAVNTGISTVILGGVTSSADVALTSGGPQVASGGGSHDGLLGRFGPCPAVFAATGSGFPADSGTYYDIPVSAPTGCSWTVTSNAPWATVVNGSGTGNGSFNLTLNQNVGCARTGTLQLPSGSLYTINQSHLQCVLFSPAQSWFPANAGTYTVQLWSFLPSTTWEVYSLEPSYATVPNGLSRTGSGSVTLQLAANTGAYRVGYLYLAPFGTLFRIDQLGGAAPLSCSYAISPGAQSAARDGLSGSFLVSALGECGWTAATTASWVTLTSSSGSGDGVVGYEIAANTTGQPRAATIVVGGQTFTITQSGQ